MRWESTESPKRYLRTQVFDLTTGEHAGGLENFVELGKDLLDFITDGTFRQVYPGEITGADWQLSDEMARRDNDYSDPYFYLTETNLGLYMSVEGEEGYWAFEAPYEQIELILTEKLLVALGFEIPQNAVSSAG